MKDISDMDMEINIMEMYEFEEFMPMTSLERKKMREWVYSGYSVDENPWGYEDRNGYPINFIEALRLNKKIEWGECYHPCYLVIKN